MKGKKVLFLPDWFLSEPPHQMKARCRDWDILSCGPEFLSTPDLKKASSASALVGGDPRPQSLKTTSDKTKERRKNYPSPSLPGNCQADREHQESWQRWSLVLRGPEQLLKLTNALVELPRAMNQGFEFYFSHCSIRSSLLWTQRNSEILMRSIWILLTAWVVGVLFFHTNIWKNNPRPQIKPSLILVL